MATRPHPSTWLPLWQRALDPTCEIGIRFRITGITREQFRDYLYTARKNSGDPRLQDLIMFLPGGECTDEIWICKKQVELDA